jgi:hypothetical protein
VEKLNEMRFYACYFPAFKKTFLMYPSIFIIFFSEAPSISIEKGICKSNKNGKFIGEANNKMADKKKHKRKFPHLVNIFLSIF